MPIRTRNIYDPKSQKPFKLSRSRLENLFRCQRCFYLDRRLGIDQPSGPPFTLNTAVDHLLKKEFDVYRARKKPHPLMVDHKIDAIPFSHADLNIWRENFKGVRFHHKKTNLIVTGAVDDVWQDNQSKSLIVVDYKATSKDGDIVLDQKWHESYKRQMEIYQWLLRQNGFEVASTGYFVYVNALKSQTGFNGVLKFKIQLISHTGKADWVEDAIIRAHDCLNQNQIPEQTNECEFCIYGKAITDLPK